MTMFSLHSNDWKSGTEWRGPTREMTIERILAFSGGVIGEDGWPHHNLHTDEKIARASGLPGIIASGTQFEGHLLELLISVLGESWLEHGQLSVRIPKSVYVGDFLTPVVVLAKYDEDNRGRIFVFDVRVENQRGEQVLVGVATHHVPNDGISKILA